ncbi:hypothetical protein, conserved [Plasmodium vivax]|uniref:VIR protein n=1 Tax=Plasmodium vivax TaxID=5855 RepID=A0A1G4EFG1_PLAVI|nr:hypothetical protein, conserved [Plasmodium vivax]
MGCDAKIKSDSYDFFKDIENYIKKANDAQQNKATTEITSNCEGFYMTMKSSFEDKQIGVSVCESIIKLYKNLNNLKAESTCSKDYKNECGFFNYWVNSKIAESMSNESNSIQTIYNGIESQFSTVDGYGININFICNINKDDLHKMNILYRLYKNYTDLNDILDNLIPDVKVKSLSLSTACCTDYIKASYICNHDNKKKNPIFCEKLEAFESKYKQLNQKVNKQGSDFSNYFIKLSDCSNNKIISTAVTGSIIGLIPLLGVLYKFTPMGQMLRSKMGILNNNISNNDEDMTNMSLIEQENEPLRFKQGTYNIKYQSL